MAYWWVNQNQTYTHEFAGGYLWSPKTRSDGGRNQFYENMTLVQPGDIVFSYADTFIKAVGIVASLAYESPKPKVFGSAGEYWSNIGWKVEVVYKLVESQVRPKEHMSKIGPLLPGKYSPLQANGNGIQSVYLAALPDELGGLILDLTNAQMPNLEVGRLEDLTKLDNEEQEIVVSNSLNETMKVTLVKARRGQGIFRDRVQTIEGQCRVTGVRAETLLIASHIKPWAESENDERLDGNNGLFLSPHVDKLFDKGLISFEKSGSMLVSPSLDDEVLVRWSIDPNKKYGRFNSEQAFFLEHHNRVIFNAG